MSSFGFTFLSLKALGQAEQMMFGGKAGVLTEYAAPCGVCRQVMMEFCNPETFQVILAVDKEHYDVYTLKELLPLGFGPSNLA